eukprot:jgi/Tetstr1/445685/TSEL_003489.t1
MVGNLAQIVRHFGFSDTTANKIASALDMVPTKVFSHTDASGVRKLWVRVLPDPINEHAYTDRKRALQDSNGIQEAWPVASWQHTVESVLFVECQSKTGHIFPWRCPISASAPTRISASGALISSGREARTAACADISPQRGVAVSRVQR